MTITMAKHNNKPLIETLINSVALSLTPLGILQISKGDPWGYVMVIFGVSLEFGKYWGRKQEYW